MDEDGAQWTALVAAMAGAVGEAQEFSEHEMNSVLSCQHFGPWFNGWGPFDHNGPFNVEVHEGQGEWNLQAATGVARPVAALLQNIEYMTARGMLALPQILRHLQDDANGLGRAGHGPASIVVEYDDADGPNTYWVHYLYSTALPGQAWCLQLPRRFAGAFETQEAASAWCNTNLAREGQFPRQLSDGCIGFLPLLEINAFLIAFPGHSWNLRYIRATRVVTEGHVAVHLAHPFADESDGSDEIGMHGSGESSSTDGSRSGAEGSADGSAGSSDTSSWSGDD